MINAFYLEDSRQRVGNDLMFWAEDRCGYTTNLDKAHVFTEEEAMCQHESRKTDIPWPVAYLDARTKRAVDFQHVDHEVAMAEHKATY